MHNVWGKVNIGYLYMNRFAQLMVRKPGAGIASSLLATLLAPLVCNILCHAPAILSTRKLMFVQGWLISTLTAAYYKKEIPMREYGLEPEYGFARCVSSCLIAMLPDGFYDRVKEGCIVIKKSRSFSFCEDGLVLDGAGERVRADLVILATGFRGDQKLRDMFVSPRLKEIVAGSSDTTIPLYRSAASSSSCLIHKFDTKSRKS